MFAVSKNISIFAPHYIQVCAFLLVSCTLNISTKQPFCNRGGKIVYKMQRKFQFTFLYFLMITYIAPVIAQDEAGSNIISRRMLSADGKKKIEQRVFDNGLGDIVQEIQSYPGSTLKSVIISHEYDELRRKTKTWLPVTSSSGNDFVNNISTLAYSLYGPYGPKAFSLTEYDEFLPSQPSAHYKAGAKWQDNKKKVSVTYSDTTLTGLYITNNGVIYKMPYSDYFCTKTIDEDGCYSAEYTDFNGRLIISETSQGMTYYAYNANGDISYVIPPILSKYIISGGKKYIKDTDDMMQKYAYVYHYDNQRHCTYKKLPGCDPIYYIYDKAGRVAYMKDPALEGRNRFYLYDKFGRLCVQGTCNGDNQGKSILSTTSYVSGTNNGICKTGYTIPYTISDPKLEIVNYYDNYTFKDMQQKTTMPTVTVDDNQKQYSIGSLTGTVVYATNGEALGTINVYDQKGQVVRSVRKGLGGFVEDVNTAYTFTGAIDKTTANVNVKYGSNFVAQTTYTYDYDKKTRMKLSVTHGSSTRACETEYNYDTIGRLTSKKRYYSGPNSSYSYCSYIYDMHGWLTNIYSGGFREELYYADGLDGGCYNGNISTMKWKANDDSDYKGYNLKYDDNNRLKNAVFGTGDKLTSSKDFFNEYAEYDCNGNITRLQRRGLVNMYGGFGLVDDLYMTYNGNQLTSVRDNATHPAYNGATDFYTDSKTKSYALTYNNAGSLVSDAGRKIAYIKYDNNNNPVLITFTDGSETEYVYSATGEKLRVIYITAKPNVVTRKVGEFIDGRLSGAYWINYETVDYLLGGALTLKNGRIDKYQFEEGYCQASAAGSVDYFDSYYYDCDHLGNIRQVIEPYGTNKSYVIQKMDYYPFGAEFCDNNTKSYVQNHKYNGKEFDNMHGLNTYDYGARQYNPVTGRWDRIDPHCEKYYNVSPYNYCHNNPINRIDLDGNDDYFSNMGKFLYTKGTGANIYIQQGKSFSNFSNFDLRNSGNRQMAARVVGHYAREVGADRNYNGKIGTIGVSTLHSTDQTSGVLAGTVKGNIFVKFTNGFLHKELYNKYNLMGVFIHEKEHKSDQQKGENLDENGVTSANRHARIVINEMSSENFSNCSENYQIGQMLYLASFADQIFTDNRQEAYQIAREANAVLSKLGYEMYYKNGEAYFREINKKNNNE